MIRLFAYLFAHRGFHSENIPPNSIASLEAAHEYKFQAVEFDIWFLEGKLLLKHDEPKAEELPSLPHFRDYFRFKNDMDYWLDFKNLDEKNAREALILVKKDLDEAGINMQRIYFAPFITDYELAKKVFVEIRNIFGNEAQLVAVCEDEKNIEILYNFLTKNNVKSLSINHKIIDKDFMKKFSNIQIFAWTVNDLERLLELEALGVKNFATDKITPQNYDKNSHSSRT